MPVQDTAATFIGLSNDNEFFSAHYLADVFQGDFAATIQEWGAAKPLRAKRLSRAGLGQDFSLALFGH